jgi:hypothetical protein
MNTLRTFFFLCSSLGCCAIAVTFYSSCNPDECCVPIEQGKSEMLNSFVRYNNYVYAIKNESIEIYFVKTDGKLDLRHKLDVSRHISAVLIRDGKLVALSNIIQVFDLSDPELPVEYYVNVPLSDCNNIDIAGQYLFSSGGTRSSCSTFAQETVDVWDMQGNAVSAPIASITAGIPKGVAIEGNKLFTIGDLGLYVFDITDVQNAILLKQYPDIIGTEAIAGSNLLTVTTATGLEQYDYTDLNDIQLLSKIPFRQ